jgi:hypothetical protein
MAAAALLTLGACSEEEAPKVVDNTPKAPPPPPPPPPVTPISDLMAQYGIDSRILLSENYAPLNDPDRIALLKCFHSMVTGNTTDLSMMLSTRDQPELSALQADGSFQEAVSDITSVELRAGITPNGDSAVVAIIQTYSDPQPQLWRYQSDSVGGGTFSSGPTPLNVMNKLSSNDWVNQWYELLEQEIAIAMQLEEDVQVPQKDLSNESNAKTSGGGSSPSGPGRPAVVPDRPVVEPPPSFAPDNG